MDAAAASPIGRRQLIGTILILVLLRPALTRCAVTAFTFDLNEPAEGIEEWIRGEPAADHMEVDAPKAVVQSVRKRGGQGKRTRDLVPDYFKFDLFASKHKRLYDQPEECLRRTIFMRKVVDIFKARVDYRLGRKSYREAANEFSDKTESEFRLMLQPAPPPEFSKLRPAQQQQEPARSAAAAAAGTDASNIEEFSSQLRERRRLLSDKASLRAHFLEGIPSQACAATSSTDELELARRELDKYIEEARRQSAREINGDQLERLVEVAVREELSGMAFESFSRTAAAGDEAASRKRPLPWPGQLEAPADRPDGPGTGHDQPERPYEPPRAKLDQLIEGGNLDWSEHECFHEVYEQKPQCGNCYVYATTALAEFYVCSERGPSEKWARRKFSKRYVMDCGQKFTPLMMGCAGGSPLDSLRFMASAGVHSIKLWNELRNTRLARLLRQLAGADLNPLDVSCPLEPHETPIEQWGSIRLNVTPRLVHPNDWLEALEDGPLVATVQMPSVGVDSYAGGVHDGQGCASSASYHTMLLVGYGLSERGQPYWRFRNSFGPNWGDAGHLNLAMDVPGACLVGGIRVYRRRADN